MKKPAKLRKLVERSEREGYVLYESTPEHRGKLADIQSRILNGLDDISCLDGFIVLLGMTAFVAACGARNRVDSLEVMNRETFLKNCAERYDALSEWYTERRMAVNTEGGEA